ncbi:MAG: effector-associated domain EAD1-containing protein, partial [Chloroflexota bacterium]
MKLTGVQYEQFREALLSAFPSHANLSQMVRIQFNKNLDVIAMGANLGEIAFNLIGVAEAEGWTDLLLRGAYEARPNNPELKAFAAQLERNQRLENFFPSQSLKSPVASSASNNSPKFEETLG